MQSRFGLHGKRALVTGAGSGLGAHFAHTLGQAGAAVALAGRREAPLREQAERLRGLGITADWVAMDVCQPESVSAGLARLLEQGPPLDVVVCNAGVAVNRKALDLAPADWRQVIDTNLSGCWHVSAEAARHWVAQQRPGAIVNISSILGHRVAGAVLPYTVSKAGLEQMTRALALEWARHGIRVNALAPGYVETDLNREFFASPAGQKLLQRIPQRRLAQPAELDGALLLLASEASSYMTGSTIVVDGGHLQSSL